jgi:ActR/RegA family two-component response regulator
MNAPLPSSTSSDPNQIGLLLSRDLIFTTKIQGTAQVLGYRVEVTGDLVQARSKVETLHPRVIFVDLTAGELSAPLAIAEYARLAGPDAWLIAFGSHVEGAALLGAKAAGCQNALPRSKFAGDLPALLQFYFTRRPQENSQSNESR